MHLVDVELKLFGFLHALILLICCQWTYEICICEIAVFFVKPWHAAWAVGLGFAGNLWISNLRVVLISLENSRRTCDVELELGNAPILETMP